MCKLGLMMIFELLAWTKQLLAPLMITGQIHFHLADDWQICTVFVYKCVFVRHINSRCYEGDAMMM